MRTDVMRCDCIVKTWWNDLSFCSYCLRFLEKYWREPDSNIIVLANRDCEKVCRDWRFSEQVRYYYVDPWPDGNQFQCYITFLADHFSDADLFAVFDSETMLVQPMRASDQMLDGKPIIHYEPVAEMVKNPGRIVAHNLWFPIMEYWLGERPFADYMCRFPMFYWSSTIQAVRRLVTRKTGLGFLESLYSDAPFSPKRFVEHPFKMCEHNVLGFYAQLHQADKYHFAPVTEWVPRIRQYHSWSDWNAGRIDEFEAMLRV